MTGQERVRQARDGHEEHQEERVRVLGHEQARHPFDVADHPATLGQDPGHPGELPVEQHELGGGLGGLGGVAHGHADVGVLEGHGVVHAVAGHGHGVALGLEGSNHRSLLVRAHPAEHHVGGDRLGQVLGLLAQGAGVDGLPHVQSEVGGDGRHGGGVVARDDPDAHALLLEEPEGVSGIGADPLGQGDQGLGPPVSRQALVRERRRRRLHEQDPAALGGELGHLGPLGGVVVEEHVGRAEEPRPVVAERRRAPLPGGRERHGPVLAPPLRWRTRHPDGGQAGIGVGCRGHGPEGGAHPLLVVAALERHETVELDVAEGEGAGLVQAHHVDPGQALHGGKLLHQHPTPGQGQGGEEERDAGEQHQAFGHHAHQGGHRAGDGFAPVARLVAAELGPHEQRGDTQDDPGDVAQEGVDALLELGAGPGEHLDLGGQAPGVGVGPHRGGLEPARARQHHRPRQHLPVGVLRDGIGLAREGRLVDLQAGGLEQDAVGGNLVAAAQLQQVVEHHLGHRELVHPSPAHHPGGGGVEQGQAVERSLGPQLLDDADEGVQHQDHGEQGVAEATGGQDRHCQHGEDGVEPGEHVGADDLADRARGGLVDLVGLPVGDPAPDVGLRQPFGAGGRRRGGNVGGRHGQLERCRTRSLMGVAPRSNASRSLRSM